MTEAVLLFLELSAGRVLDAMVAEEVLGWKDCDPHMEKFTDPGRGMGVTPTDNGRFQFQPIPDYSTKIEDAWPILEMLYEETKHAKVKRIFKWEHFEDGLACHYPRGPWGVQFGESCQFAFGDTAPVAICRAAILHARKLDWPVYPGGKKED